MCDCDTGYKGQLCDECEHDYFTEEKNNTHTICKSKFELRQPHSIVYHTETCTNVLYIKYVVAECHESCEDECTGTGPEGCTTCKKGWSMIEGAGCYGKIVLIIRQIHRPSVLH